MISENFDIEIYNLANKIITLLKDEDKNVGISCRSVIQVICLLIVSNAEDDYTMLAFVQDVKNCVDVLLNKSLEEWKEELREQIGKGH